VRSTLLALADTTGRRRTRQDTRVSLSRIAWLLTVAVCLIIAGVLLLNHYRGYPAVALAIAVAAAINLF
jgi:hypothetical protein